MRAVLTVVGKDTTGIIAVVATKLAELEVNIVDVTQTVMDEFFTMMMLCELPEGANFTTVKEELQKAGEEKGLDIRIQNEEIFDVMHKL